MYIYTYTWSTNHGSVGYTHDHLYIYTNIYCEPETTNSNQINPIPNQDYTCEKIIEELKRKGELAKWVSISRTWRYTMYNCLYICIYILRSEPMETQLVANYHKPILYCSRLNSMENKRRTRWRGELALKYQLLFTHLQPLATTSSFVFLYYQLNSLSLASPSNTQFMWSRDTR